MSPPRARRVSRPSPNEQEAQEEPDEAAVIHSVPAAGRAPLPARRLLLMGVLVAAFGGGAARFISRLSIESTDDAQIDADVVGVAARTSGTVQAVHFVENQPVRQGQLLAELDDATARAKLAQAEANLSAARAAAHAADVQAELTAGNAKGDLAVATASLQNMSVGVASSEAGIAEAQARLESTRTRLQQAEQDLARAHKLFDTGALSRAQLDQAVTARDVADTELTRAQAALTSVKLTREQARSRIAEARAKRAQSDQVEALVREAQARTEQAHAAVATAEAARALAELELSYTKIRAPTDGVVSKKRINVGQTVATGQSVVLLVPSPRWVTANFKETQLDHMRVGQPVTISIDAYPGRELRGHVESFSAATGARFALLPPDNATGNFTKVVARVPVRVHVDSVPASIALRPGLSVDVSVDTAAKPVAHDDAAATAAQAASHSGV